MPRSSKHDKQSRPNSAKFQIAADDTPQIKIRYGLYKRKGKLHPSFTERGCLRNECKLMCLHLWIKASSELHLLGWESMNLNEFNTKLQFCYNKSLTPDELGYERDWTSHVFHSGSAVDVLQSQGVAAMMKHGGSGSETAAQSYATLDEIDTRKLKATCCSVIDLSDDD